MSNVFSGVLATFITVPVLVYLLVFIVCKKVTNKHRQAVNLAMDISTLFFIFAIHFLALTIWSHSYFWVIFIFMMVCAIIFVILNWKIKGEIIFNRFIKGYWRFSFFLFFIAYVVLLSYGIIMRVTDTLK